MGEGGGRVEGEERKAGVGGKGEEGRGVWERRWEGEEG